MGIIAGVSSGIQEGMHKAIESMIASQVHRDMSTPKYFFGSRIALGMANKHDSSYGNGRHSLAVQESGIEAGTTDIVAIVDGIVLISSRSGQGCSANHQSCADLCSAHAVQQAYREWELGFAEKLEGEFSCAVWDNNNKRIVLVRDPYGHKPLHYYCKDGFIAFSTEIKGIIASGIRCSIDATSLSDFLSLNCVPCPGTMFRDVYQVPPGCMVIIENGSVRTKQYHSHAIEVDNTVTEEEAVRRFSEAFSTAVRKRMVSDETYCFLSGGLDSSALVSFAAELSDKPIHAVSVGFEEEDRNELEFAAAMSRHVGAIHHQVMATPGSFLDMLDTLVYHHDSPFTDTSAYPTYFAGKLAKNFTDIIMTGDGPDQMLGGSGHHGYAIRNNLFRPRNSVIRSFYGMGADILKHMVRQPAGSLAAKMKRKMYRNSLSPVHALYDLRSAFPDVAKEYLCSASLWDVHRVHDPYRHPEAWFAEAGDTDDINRYLYADMKFYVTDDLMIKVDRMCMAHGLETLSPFQDLELGRIANSLPGKFKIRVEGDSIITKNLLREVCRDRFPEIIANKPKQGFGIPVGKWLRHNGCQFVKDVLLDEKTLSRGYFDRIAISRLVEDFASGRDDYFFPSSMGIVALLTLELWHRKYLD